MGKAFKRGMNKGRNNQFETLSREEAVKKAVKSLKKHDVNEELITLFGLSSEELLEAGASYEEVKGIEGILND